MSRGPGTPSRDLTSVVLCSSRMISMQSSTHSSQMKTVGPAISFLTSCWLLPQKEQHSVFFESPPLDFVIATPSPGPAEHTRRTDRACRARLGGEIGKRSPAPGAAWQPPKAGKQSIGPPDGPTTD